MDPSAAVHPIAGPPPERAHAARNRARVLAAAERLFSERCPSQVTMDAVAEEAGVGKGTLYRRFGDRAGLAIAVLDRRERALQERILRGAPPLGPGAPAAERLAALLDELVDQLRLDVELVALAAHGGARLRSGAYRALHMHVAMLLRDIDPGADHDVLADLMLAPFNPDLFRHLRERGVDPERLRASLRRMIAGLAAAAGSPGPG